VSSNQLLLVVISLASVGLSLLCDSFGYVPLSVFIIFAPTFVVAGMLVAETRSLQKTAQSVPTPKSKFLWAASIVIGALSIYHVAITGIALFSTNVELDRFNFGASGLFGLPSRSVLLGLPALALYTVAKYSPDKKNVTLFVWSLFTITQFSLGFKGAMFSIVSTLILGFLISGRLSMLRLTMLSLIGVTASSIYVLSVAASYGTLRSSNLNIQLIIDRVTLETARPQYLALRMQETLNLLTGSAFWHDMSVLLERYLTGFTPSLTVESIVSATLTGTPPSREYFIVPVTLGGPVYILLTGGVALTIAILFILGFFWSRSTLALKQTQSDLIGVLLALFLDGLKVFLTNGNGAYLTINLAFTALLFTGIALFYRPKPPIARIFVKLRKAEVGIDHAKTA
jgi:uncharacterized membrane protein YqaE (UPF0057 family)